MSRTAGGGGGAAAATAATIVVVAKCPLPGASKTRLVELLGGTGSAALAQALLSDVVTAISHCVSVPVCDIYLYIYECVCEFGFVRVRGGGRVL